MATRPWDSNHLACANTWAFLRGLGELKGSFAKVGDMQMKDLAFWNDTATVAARMVDATALASRLDSLFVKALLAKYEAGSSRTVAVQAVAGALADKTTTVSQLSYVVDDNYNFRGEIR